MDLKSLDEKVAMILDDLREQMFRKNMKGVKSMSRIFKTADYTNDGLLDDAEFEEALNVAGLFLKTNDRKIIFKYFDADQSGTIAYSEFVVGIAPPLNQRRQQIVDKAFFYADYNNSGDIDLSDCQGRFNGSKHPQVLNGQLTADQALDEFLNGFDGNGVVSRAEWGDYYRDLSSAIPSDDYFCSMVESIWGITEDGTPAASDVRVQQLIKILVEKVRQKTRGGGDLSRTLESTFKFFDKDESGEVTPSEFESAMKHYGIVLTKKELRFFFSAFDVNGSGTITAKEFCDVVFPGMK